MIKKRKGGYVALICDDCREEIFVDINMLMLKNELWESIIKLAPKKLKVEDALCVDCMESRLKRPLTRKDWEGMPPCNLLTEEHRKSLKQK